MLAAGILTGRFHRERSGYIFWFRDEQIDQVCWAGNPQKVHTAGPLGDRLTPRGSFAAWREEVRGKSNAWLASELEIATQFRSGLQDIALSKSTLSERARDTLFATLGHDLRDPLQAIMMAAQMLERQSEDDSSESTLGKRITNSSSRMKRLISQVLDFSRIQNGLGLSIKVEPTDMCVLLTDIVRESRMAHPELHIDIDCADAGTADVDPDRMSQVISNLLSNAHHHGEAGKPIYVHAFGTDSSIKICVSNYGEKIDPKVLPTLFSPFKSGAKSTRNNRNGLGLGLFIISEIVKGHGGTINVTSEDGKFHFALSFRF